MNKTDEYKEWKKWDILEVEKEECSICKTEKICMRIGNYFDPEICHWFCKDCLYKMIKDIEEYKK